MQVAWFCACVVIGPAIHVSTPGTDPELNGLMFRQVLVRTETFLSRGPAPNSSEAWNIVLNPAYFLVRGRRAYNHRWPTVMFFVLVNARNTITTMTGEFGVVELSINLSL